MAFTATIRNMQYSGPGKSTLTGDWSGAVGDAAGTMTIGGVVTKADFMKFDSDNTFDGAARVSSSISSGITTLTIYNGDNVVTGYFTIEKLG